MGTYEDYSKADFGDKRLSKRMKILLDQLSGNPSANISAASKDPYQAKAAYRFFANGEVTTEAITQITHDVTMENIKANKPEILLIVQDTTELNYSNLKATDGLGNVGYKESSKGLIVHSAVAVGETGEIFGLLAQTIWIRPPEEHGKRHVRKQLPIEEKESYKWLEAIENAGTTFPEGVQAVHICDREGDIYEFFCKAEREGTHYLCRRVHNRTITEDDVSNKLNEFVEALPESERIEVRIPRDSHTNKAARDAVLAIKHGKCRIMKSVSLPSGGDLPKSIEAYVVAAVEVDPPDGEEKISWQLVTNVPTESVEDAVTRIQWYTQRWKIETLHRTLKSGCKVEELQSDTAEKLMKLIAVYSIIALQIMQLTYVARTRPEESCEICLTEEEWKVLCRISNKTKKVPEKPPTIYEAVVMIAKLGGFLARKSDGFPGVVVIWRGLTCFYTVLDALPFL